MRILVSCDTIGFVSKLLVVIVARNFRTNPRYCNSEWSDTDTYVSTAIIISDMFILVPYFVTIGVVV